MTAIDVRPGPETGSAVTAALRTLSANITEFGDRFPGDTTTRDRYTLRPAAGDLPEGSNVGWTTAFWPGMYWLAYDLTGDRTYRDAAAAFLPGYAERIAQRIDVETHDLGFLYTLSCVAAYKRTGDKDARDAAIAAADHLLRRVLPSAGIIQAWGDLTDSRQRGRTIIDSLMNTPLLFWAGKVTGDPKYAAAARRHTAQLRDNILRDDDTTFHTFYWDQETGRPLRGETEQGSADDSCWARGQAWGIYGFTLNHRHTGDPTLLAAAVRCADYFLAHLPADSVAYWDLVYGDGDGQERDSSAAAIAVNGLLALADAGAPRADRYRAAALRILRSLIDGYTDESSNALLLHGVYDKPKSVGVDEGTLWGDYFYLEALTRVTQPNWKDHW
ncbi:glycoside hydrolase family 88 protein [Actinoplanes sp. NBRC 101535]|uniref:glycoside hydrolase family 88 protein n=1 Tax=Actinoplanes sp. NBRC 101535 TaxID=3032196 RepID=UPI0024A05FCE|nr:glycoside hydrolase family 88 protein [Actinoplanes sp. NBRC 101535]GLY02661.1 glycosyl hydrolase [Actinoplanes sp. NBRC 101535]